MNRKTEIAVIIGLLVIAFFLRTYRLGQLMPFTFDQGRDMYALLQMSRGDLALIGPTTGLQGVFLGPFYFYFLLPGFLLTSGSPIGVAHWVAFWTTLALPLFYLILKRVVGWKWALLGFGLLVISFGSVDEARVIWNPSLAAPILLLSWWSLFNSKLKPQFLLLSALMYGLSLQTELAYTVFLFPAYAWWVLYHRRHYSWKIILGSVLVVGATILPQALFEVRNEFIMTKSFFAEKSADYHAPFLKIWGERPTQLAAVIQQRTLGFLGYFNLGFIGILLATMFVATKKPRPIERFFILVFLLPIIGLLFHTGNYGYFFPYYLNPHYLPTLILILLALYRLPYNKILAMGLTAVVLYMFIQSAQVIYSPNALQYTITHQLNALRAVRNLKQTDDPGLQVYVPNLLPINYQYLNEWLAFSGQESSINFGGQADEYFLLYEGSPVAQAFTFDPWYEQWTTNASCTNKQQFGIIYLEQCRAEK